MKEGKRGQFYLMATIIIVGLVIGFAVVSNYSTKSNSYNVEEIAKELSIESENVMNYDTFNSQTQFENFARDYSSYVDSSKSIYFIRVNGENVDDREAYKFSDGFKVSLNSDLSVNGNVISFQFDEKTYNFKLEEGKNIYFLLVSDNGGERYVISG
jgi:hypothetical protein